VTFKQSLLDIANQLFAARGIIITYDEDEAIIKKTIVRTKESFLSKESRFILDQKSDAIQEDEYIDEKLTIESVFNYVNRHTTLKLLKKTEEQKEKNLSIPSCTMSESVNQISTSMPIRNVRIEPKIKNSSRHLKDNLNSEQKKCSCCLL
jgi:uncharacterized FlgJ-related protein